MINIVSSLSVLGILSTALQICHSRENEVFTIIFSRQKQLSIQKSNESSPAKKIVNFLTPITALALHEDYFYVSVSTDYSNYKGGTIWRAKTVNATSNATVGENSNANWEEFDVAGMSDGNITCMLLVDGLLFVGFTNKILWVCEAGVPKSCKFFDSFDSEVTGMDYNPIEKKLYVSSGSLLSCSLREEKSCKEMPILGRNNESINTLKISFGFLWLGVDGSQLWKCYLDRISEDYIDREIECDVFDKYPVSENKIKSIVATNKYLYVNNDATKKMSRCEPERRRSCVHAFRKPSALGSFVIEK